jgi:hypothetical protein
MACPLRAGTLSVHRFFLLFIVLCSIVVFFAALANAQDSPAPAQNAGWWSPATMQSTQAPQLKVGMAELTRFEATGLLNAASSANLALTPSDDSIANFQNTGSALNASVAQQALWAQHVSAPATTLLGLVETKYASWESSLSDTRTLTNVNGMSVYPIFQANYASSYVPVTLYISSLRGSNAW